MPKPKAYQQNSRRKQYQEFPSSPSSPSSSPTPPKDPFASESDSDSSSQKPHLNLAEPDVNIPTRYKKSPYAPHSSIDQQRQRSSSRPVPRRINSYNTTSSSSSYTHKSPLSDSRFQINANSEPHKHSDKPKNEHRGLNRDNRDTPSQSETASVNSSNDIPLEEFDVTWDKRVRNLPPGFGDDESRSSFEFLEAFEGGDKSERHSKKKTCSFSRVPLDKRRTCVFLTFIIFVGLIIGLCVFIPRVPSSAIVSIEVVGEPSISSMETLPYSFNFSTSLSVVFNNINQYPVTINEIDINAFPRYGLQQLGHTTVRNIHLPGNRVTYIKIPISMSYTWDTPNDKTWTAFAFACRPELIYLPYKNSMSLEFKNTMSVLGFVKKAPIQWQGSFVCPNN